MEELVLICTLIAIFIVGYFVMKRVDEFLFQQECDMAADQKNTADTDSEE